MKRTTHTIRVLSLLLTLAVLFCSYTFIATAQQSDSTQTEESPISATQSDGKFLNEISFEGTGEYIYAVYELNDRREENVKHFSMPDGTYRAVVYGEAVHRLGADGKWADIDNSLNLTKKNGMSLYSDAEGRISFAGSAQPSAQGSFLFSLTENGYMLAMALKGNTNGSGSLNLGSIPATASVAAVTNPATKEALTPEDSAELQFEKLSAVDNQTEIFYADILSGTDLEYTLRSNSIKENIVVKSPQASYVYSFEVATKGLTAALSDDGSITLSDSETNTSVYYIPAPYMTDADGNVSHDVSYSLTELSEGSYELTVTASAEWINAQDRSFPVKIDPTVMSRSGIHDTYISNLVDEATSSEYGNEDYLSLMPEFLDENGVLRRTIGLIRGDLPSIPETAIVTNASLIMNLSFPGQTSGEAVIIARNITAPWNEDDASWWPECNNIGLDATMVSTQITSASSKLVSLDITPFVQAANCITANYHGVALFNAALPNGGEIRIKSSEASENYLITTVTYVDGIEEGVYAIESVVNDNHWITVDTTNPWGGDSVIQRYYDDVIPTASLARSSMFKFSIVPGTDRIVIRSMMNNRLTLDVSGPQITTKLIPVFDSDVNISDTFYVRSTESGIVITSVSDGETVIAAPPASQSDLITAPENYSGDYDRWRFQRFSGTDFAGGMYEVEGDIIAGENVYVTMYTWSTKVGANSPHMSIEEEDYGIAESEWDDLQYKMRLIPHDEGRAHATVTISDETGVCDTKRTSFYVSLPVKNGTYYLQNRGTGRYLQIDNSYALTDPLTEGAQMELWAYDAALYQCWKLTHLIDGYYKITSTASDMALSVPSGFLNMENATLIQEAYNDEDRQQWKVSIIGESRYKISPKSAEEFSLERVMAAQNTTSANGMKAQQRTYTDDSNYFDEWYIDNADQTEGIENGAVYYIKAKSNKNLIAAPPVSATVDGTKIQQDKKTNGLPWQRWKIIHTGYGDYKIQDVYTGSLLSVTASSPNSEVDLQLWHDDGTTGQLFKIRKNTDGTYTFLSKCSNYTKAINFNELSDNVDLEKNLDAIIKQTPDNGTNNQKFDLIKSNKAMIIVPGILGSELYTTETDNGTTIYTKLFTSDSVTNLEGLSVLSWADNMSCNSDGTSKYSVAVKEYREKAYSDIVTISCGFDNQYQYLYDNLKDNYSDEYVIEFFSYDWRLSNGYSAQELAEYIERYEYEEVVLIAHSMGGLVASGYLTLGKFEMNKVNKVVYLASPLLGTPAIANIVYNDDISAFKDMMGSLNITSTELYLIDALNGINTLLCNYASIYELFPSEYYFTLSNANTSYISITYTGDPIITTETTIEKWTYDDSKALISSAFPNFNQALINQAEQFHSTLFVDNQHVSFYTDSKYLCCTTENANLSEEQTHLTDLHCDYIVYTSINTSQQKLLVVDVKTDLGDGLVLKSSATLHNLYPSRTFTYYGNHMDLIRNGYFEYIKNAINN